jgi:hypothetical protein
MLCLLQGLLNLRDTGQAHVTTGLTCVQTIPVGAGTARVLYENGISQLGRACAAAPYSTGSIYYSTL